MSITANISEAMERLKAAENLVTASQKKYNDYAAGADEYQRQATDNASKGNYAGADFNSGKRDEYLGYAAAEQIKLVRLKKDRDDLKLALDALKANLTEPEKKELESKSEIEKILAKSLGIVAVQKTTQYLIWGGVALVVIIAAVFIFKKKFAA
jgi:hypothetical protein